MAGTKEIKRRIKSVKNTRKITKAMELVAASKMKRAVSRATSSRLYSLYSWELLKAIAISRTEISHELFKESGGAKILLALITSNNGLCGAYNSQVLKSVLALTKSVSITDIDFVTIGKKGDAAIRRAGGHIIASFTDMPDNITLRDTLPISKILADLYKSGNYCNISVAYTDFISAINQKAKIKRVLPISEKEIEEFESEVGEENSTPKIDISKTPPEYLFEGGLEAMLDFLALKVIRTEIYQMFLESKASEQSSRMIAMKNATDAAGEMVSDLTLVFNKARQAGITQEISEISAGMASVS